MLSTGGSTDKPVDKAQVRNQLSQDVDAFIKQRAMVNQARVNTGLDTVPAIQQLDPDTTTRLRWERGVYPNRGAPSKVTVPHERKNTAAHYASDSERVTASLDRLRVTKGYKPGKNAQAIADYLAKEIQKSLSNGVDSSGEARHTGSTESEQGGQYRQSVLARRHHNRKRKRTR